MLYDEEEARRNIKLKNSLIERFKGIRTSEVREYDEKKKQDKPVIEALQAQSSEMCNAIHELGERLRGTSIKSYLSTSPQTRVLKEGPPTSEETISESIAITLNNSNDFVFGIRLDGDKKYIGDTEVEFNNGALRSCRGQSPQRLKDSPIGHDELSTVTNVLV